MLAHSHILLEEKSNIVENIPTECVETLKVFNSQDMKTIGREELVREFDKRFQEQKVNHDQQLQNVQEQFENFIAEKEKTLAQMVDEFKSRRDRNK
jgi:NAD(P)H-dependent FMN reductase